VQDTELETAMDSALQIVSSFMGWYEPSIFQFMPRTDSNCSPMLGIRWAHVAMSSVFGMAMPCQRPWWHIHAQSPVLRLAPQRRREDNVQPPHAM
jgi:hypothetical protein